MNKLLLLLLLTLPGASQAASQFFPFSSTGSSAASAPIITVTVSSKGVANGRSSVANDGAAYGPDTAGTTTSGLQEAWNFSQRAGSNGPVINGFTLQLQPGYYFFTNPLVLWQTNVAAAKIEGNSLLDTKLVFAGTNQNTSCILFTNSYQDDLGFSIAGHLFVEHLSFSSINDNFPNVLFEVRNIGGASFQHLNFTGWQLMTNSVLGDGSSVSLASVPSLNPPGLVGLWLNTGGGDHGIFLEDIYLAGLADGVVAFCDHITARGIRSAWCGGIGANPAQTAWPSNNVFSLGAAIIDAVNLDGLWTYCHLYRTLAGIAKYSGYSPDASAFGGSSTFDHVNFENAVFPVIGDGGFNSKVVLRDPADDAISFTNISPVFFSSTDASGIYLSNKFSILSVPLTNCVVYGAGATTRSGRSWYVGNGRKYTLDLYTNGNFTIGGGSFTNNATNTWAPNGVTNHYGVNFAFAADPAGKMTFYNLNETLFDVVPSSVSDDGQVSIYSHDAFFTNVFAATTTQTAGNNSTLLASTAYVDQGGGWVISKVTGSDATTTGQSLVDVTGLSFAAAASTTYEIEAVLQCTTSAVTTGTQYGIQHTGTGSPSCQAIISGSFTTTTCTNSIINALNTADVTPFLTTSAQTGIIVLKGVVVSGTGAGNITVRHLKVTSGTSTVKIGSVLKVRKLI